MLAGVVTKLPVESKVTLDVVFPDETPTLNFSRPYCVSQDFAQKETTLPVLPNVINGEINQSLFKAGAGEAAAKQTMFFAPVLGVQLLVALTVNAGVTFAALNI
jgi:hypothetical protein